MDKTALVSFDIDNGQRVIDAIEKSGIVPEVALWVVLPEYEDWRLVIASKSINRLASDGGYGAINAAIRDAHIPLYSTPTIFVRDLNDPFIQSLRSAFGQTSDTYGMRLGGQRFGNQYVEDAFVYRIH
ncbi:hypothetical protein [Acidicapsa ligni]|uniref:hypothetical protein n=1 Tax=Acidicapsa ligni TaxID=542300 RepID=UPI0021DF61E7|nr:hypothetical protein [Acidicapsa ligni]